VEASVLTAPQGLSRIAAAGPLLRLRSDDQLVALFRMGYDEAFSVIHDRYRQRLFAYTRQMLAGSRSDAEDALQEVFLRAYGALRADDRPITLRAWLYRVAHNRCVDHLRRPCPAPVDLLDVSRPPLHDPLLETERREDLRRLVADVRRLPDQQRSALLMREMEGLSYVEMADALGVTIPAVKSLLVRARVGLVEAGDARDTACSDIRSELTLAFDRGVRASGRSRRHLKDCAACRDYRSALRGAQASLGALGAGGATSGPLATLAKLLGLGGAGSGAAAGGGAVAGGGAAAGGSAAGGSAIAGTCTVAAAGSAASATATKVAAIVGAAAVVGGGAAEVKTQLAPSQHAPAPPARVVQMAPSAPTTSAAARDRAQRLRSASEAVAERRAAADTRAPAAGVESDAMLEDEAAITALQEPVAPVTEDELRTGGMAAPAEDAPPVGAPTDPAALDGSGWAGGREPGLGAAGPEAPAPVTAAPAAGTTPAEAPAGAASAQSAPAPGAVAPAGTTAPAPGP
jgi:RNA polymerase sigma factor (sigma-70 family)